MNKIPRFIIIILLIFASLLSVVEIILNIQEKELSTSTQAIWDVMFFISTIFWAYYDADRKNFEKPFDFGFFIYVFWPVAFPWYLIKTRGIEGVVLYLGFIALWLFPWLSGLVTYVYFT